MLVKNIYFRFKRITVGVMGEVPKIRVLVLDFDGVITFLRIDWGFVRYLASEVAGFEIRSLLDFWREYFGSDAFFRVSELVEGYEVKAAEVAEPVPEVTELIREAAGRGVKVYVATMQSEASVVLFLRKHGLINYVADVLSREDLPTKKDMLKHILEVEGVRPEEVVFVDDSEKNIVSCRELGVRCVHARGDLGRVAELIRETLN